MTDTSQEKPEYTLGLKEAARLRDMERAFLNRPRVSIRLRIVAGFLLCFFLLAVTGLINLAILYQARGELRFLEIAQQLSLDVQHARSFARQGYRDRQSLLKARHSAQEASDALIAGGVSILDISRGKELTALNFKLGHYVQLLDDAVARLESPAPGPEREAALVRELDARSGEILDDLRAMKAREAASADRVLTISQRLPFIFAGVMLLIIFWITSLLANTITNSLNRLTELTKRIAGGDFTPTNPARRYRDEFSDLSLGVNRMLLELRARQAQVIKADRLASIGAMTAGFAHDLHNALDSTWTRTRRFMEGCHPTDACPDRKLLEGILAETERSRETVEELWDFTRDDQADEGPVDLAAVVFSAAGLIQRQMAGAGITLQNELPEAMPPVRGTFRQLKHVFLNLFHNAVQAMQSGGLLQIRGGFVDRNKVEVAVVDHGVGIPPEDLPHLFDPFFTTRGGSAGTGLGLSTAYGIVTRLGGDLRVESLVGRGTTVSVILPLAGEDETVSVSPPPAEAGRDEPARRTPAMPQAR
jgi:two-component system NtrC family sensor kinase